MLMEDERIISERFIQGKIHECLEVIECNGLGLFYIGGNKTYREGSWPRVSTQRRERNRSVEATAIVRTIRQRRGHVWFTCTYVCY